MKSIILIATILFATTAFAKSEYLVKLQPGMSPEQLQKEIGNGTIEDLEFNNWYKVTTTEKTAIRLQSLRSVNHIERNITFKYTLHQPNRHPEQSEGSQNDLNDSPFPFPIEDIIGGNGGGGNDGGGGLPIEDIIGGIGGGGNNGGDNGGGGLPIEDIIGGIGGGGGGGPSKDPDFPKDIPVTTGADPDYSKQWGMADIGVKDAWTTTQGNPEIIVGVIDTGVDYTHEDLAANIWRNPGETGTDANGQDRATNGKDDDGNGFIDDVVGWDFNKNDNKPYDTTSGGFFGGNPGHGTHCAGNIAAATQNGKGIIGVAPNVKLMALRFLGENGSGELAGAVKAIKYGADNGAKILSNSWGSEGDDGGAESQALQEAIEYAQSKGVLFVAAAGNGHMGVGYDNDNDSRPAYPASYPQENIVSVAALGSNHQLTSFSNWGKISVDLGAPGGRIYSTVTNNKYMNLDGTSMACPHVSGAAALYWSKHPNADWRQVKEALMNSVKPTPALSGKTVTGGKLDVRNLIGL